MKQRLSVFFSYGFRPFFLSAGVYAVVAPAAWVLMFATGTGAPWMHGGLPPRAWHGHEMLFGYALAVIAGFFLTAVPSWTGRRPVQGGPLALLAAAWLAGRLAMWFPAALPPALGAAVDLAFIPLLVALVARALLSGWSRRNLVFLPVLGLLFAANLLVHLEGLGVTRDTVGTGHTLALDAVVLLIAIIGGRIVPAFTTNALRRGGEADLPRSRPAVDGLAIALVLAVLVADVAAPGGRTAGALAAAAAVANGVRLAGWRSAKTLGEPILWILHLGYLWLVVGFALKAAALLGGFLAETTANHALTIGAIGTMTLGVMTRAGLGHTGRVIRAAPSIVWAYGLVSAAAVARVAGPVLAPAFYRESVLVAGIAWMAAFTIFAVVYGPVLTRPRFSRDR